VQFTHTLLRCTGGKNARNVFTSAARERKVLCLLAARNARPSSAATAAQLSLETATRGSPARGVQYV